MQYAPYLSCINCSVYKRTFSYVLSVPALTVESLELSGFTSSKQCGVGGTVNSCLHSSAKGETVNSCLHSSAKGGTVNSCPYSSTTGGPVSVCLEATTASWTY